MENNIKEINYKDLPNYVSKNIFIKHTSGKERTFINIFKALPNGEICIKTGTEERWFNLSPDSIKIYEYE